MKNNFFVKFAYFYIDNLKGIKDKTLEIWDAIVDGLQSFFVILITSVGILINLISMLLPVKQIIYAAITQYLNDEEIKKLTPFKEAGYYTKNAITKRKKELFADQTELQGEIDSIKDVSLDEELGTGDDITTPAVPTNTLLNVLQIIWNKIRQVANYFSSAIAALNSSIASDIATINTRITSIENLGHYVGSFDTFALLPTNTADFTGLITINDFATVRADETHDNNITRYIIDAIDSSGNVTWNYDITYTVDISGKADIDSPALTGTPTAPTAAEGTNNTQIATTAFVQQEISDIGGGGSISLFKQGQAGTIVGTNISNKANYGRIGALANGEGFALGVEERNKRPSWEDRGLRYIFGTMIEHSGYLFITVGWEGSAEFIITINGYIVYLKYLYSNNSDSHLETILLEVLYGDIVDYQDTIGTVNIFDPDFYYAKWKKDN